jgi:hypothetical protein
MAETNNEPELDEFPAFPRSIMRAENHGIRPLHRVLFQQFLRPFRALRARVRS